MGGAELGRKTGAQFCVWKAGELWTSLGEEATRYDSAVQGRDPGWRHKQGVLGPWMVLKADETHGLFLSVEKRRGPGFIQAPGPEAVAKASLDTL